MNHNIQVLICSKLKIEYIMILVELKIFNINASTIAHIFRKYLNKRCGLCNTKVKDIIQEQKCDNCNKYYVFDCYKHCRCNNFIYLCDDCSINTCKYCQMQICKSCIVCIYCDIKCKICKKSIIENLSHNCQNQYILD